MLTELLLGDEMVTLICKRCSSPWSSVKPVRPAILRLFVCDTCRCSDCSIPFDTDCDCGNMHGTRSADSTLCADCFSFRKTVAANDSDMLVYRNRNVSRQEPIYGIVIQAMELPNTNTLLGDNRL